MKSFLNDIEKKNSKENLISNDEEDLANQYLGFNKNSTLKARLFNKNSQLIMSSYNSSVEANNKINQIFNLGNSNDDLLNEFLTQNQLNSNANNKNLDENTNNITNNHLTYNSQVSKSRMVPGSQNGLNISSQITNGFNNVSKSNSLIGSKIGRNVSSNLEDANNL